MSNFATRNTECELTVIAPCLNEEGNIDALTRRVVGAFDDLSCDGELVLVDDGSTDRSWQMIRLHQHDNRVRGVRHPRNQGIVQAWRSGLNIARGRLVCLIDADLQNRPEDIGKLLEGHRQTGMDVVQGVRHAERGVTRLRLFSRGLNWLLNVSFGTSLRDNKSGFLLCRREVLMDILNHRFLYKYFQSLVGVSASARGYRIHEVDTTFQARNAGKSFLSRFPLAVSMRIIVELLKFRVETILWSASAQRAARASTMTSLTHA